MALLGRTVFDEDHDAFRDSVRRFVAAEVAPLLEEWRASGGAPAALFAGLGDQGFLGTAVPEECGGGGVDDPRFTAVLVEELAAVGALGLARVVAGHAGVAVAALLRLPAGGERDGLLAEVASGASLVVLAPCGSADAGPVQGVRSIVGAPHAGLVLTVPSDGSDAGLFTRDQVGVEPVTLLGGRDLAAGDVRLEPDGATVVPDAAAIRRDLDLWSAVVAVAGARAAVTLAVDYVRERKVFGRPIAEFENTRFRLAELGAELAAAGSLVDHALVALAEDGLDAATAAAAALVAAQVHDRAVDLGMQLHGGYGYMREYPIAWAFGDARQLRVAAAAGREPRRVLAEAIGL